MKTYTKKEIKEKLNGILKQVNQSEYDWVETAYYKFETWLELEEIKQNKSNRTITNKNNVPDFIVKVLSNDDYDYEENVWSASTIKKPSSIFAREQMNLDKLETDATDLIASRMGTAIHSLFEGADLGEEWEQEKRLYTEVLNQKISGKFDLLKDSKELYDIKSTSVYKWTSGDFDEYIKQLSIYNYLLYKNGYKVEKQKEATIIFWFTDWRRSDAEKNIYGNYPQSRIQIRPIKLMTLKETEKYIEDKIIEHRLALELYDTESEIDCDRETLWQPEDKYAVMKKGGSRAIKLCYTGIEAKELIESKEKDFPNTKGQYFIQKREYEPKRCDYCSCSTFCKQYLAMKHKRY